MGDYSCLLKSYWDILALIIIVGLAMVGCLTLADEWLKRKKKNNP